MGEEKKKLLVAEDELGMRKLYRRLLGKTYDIEEAENGLEAVSSYRENRPDVVLMDMRMPVMDGKEAIREIKSFDPDSKIIALTGYSYSESELGVPVLCKPFTPDELKLKIVDLIGLVIV